MICLHCESTGHLFCLHSSSTVCSFIKYTVLFLHRTFYIWGNVRSILSVTLHLFDMSIHVHSQEPNSSSSVEKSSCVTNLIISEKIWIQPLFCCLSKLKDKYHHTGAQVGGKIVLCVRMNFQPTFHSTSAIPKVISFLLRLYQLRNIILN